MVVTINIRGTRALGYFFLEPFLADLGLQYLSGLYTWGVLYVFQLPDHDLTDTFPNSYTSEMSSASSRIVYPASSSYNYIKW
jgi:hypothetical protein